mgnify:FL=1|tara:strand:+ start:1849 stop:2325 length:477 start_codon:yes stop_codon:yes gene_type:complete
MRKIRFRGQFETKIGKDGVITLPKTIARNITSINDAAADIDTSRAHFVINPEFRRIEVTHSGELRFHLHKHSVSDIFMATAMPAIENNRVKIPEEYLKHAGLAPGDKAFIRCMGNRFLITDGQEKQRIDDEFEALDKQFREKGINHPLELLYQSKKPT